jgi:exonuclease SbcD
MRILHTSDWHLGRVFFQESLLEDQALLLEQVFVAVKDTGVDALVIAGDIFDRQNPKREAVALFDEFLTRVYRDTKTAIVAIAGNHDAPERVAFGRGLQDPKRVLIRGPLETASVPLLLDDKFGKVAFSALPFAEVYGARQVFADQNIGAPADILAAQMKDARSSVPEGCRWVITAHAFVAGGAKTDSERSLALVGGIETVSPEVFSGAHYVALGHLHRSQHVGHNHIRYSGSWMAFDFDEAGLTKSMTIVDLDGNGHISVETLPFSPKRQIRVLDGSLRDLIAAGQTHPTTDFVKARLSDEGALVDPMNQLRAVYPNILGLEFTNRGPSANGGGIKLSRELNDPHALLAAFSQEVRGTGLSDAEKQQISALLARLQTEDI